MLAGVAHDGRLRRQELGGERVGLHLLRLVAADEHRDPVDGTAVAHPVMAELVREREAQPVRWLVAAEEDQRLRQVGAGDVAAERKHGDRHPRARLDVAQNTCQRLIGGEPELRPRLTGPLGPAVGVQAGHSTS